MTADLEKMPYLILDDSPDAQLAAIRNFAYNSLKSIADTRRERGMPLEPEEEELHRSKEKNRKLIALIRE